MFWTDRAYLRIFILNDSRKDREEDPCQNLVLRFSLRQQSNVDCWSNVRKVKTLLSFASGTLHSCPSCSQSIFKKENHVWNALWTPQYLWYLFRSARASFSTFGSCLRQKSRSLIQPSSTGLENQNISVKFIKPFVRSQSDICLCVSADQIKRVRSRFPQLILCPIVVFSLVLSHSQKGTNKNKLF